MLQVAQPGAAGGGDQPAGVVDVAGARWGCQRHDDAAAGGQQPPAAAEQVSQLGTGLLLTGVAGGAGGWPAQQRQPRAAGDVFGQDEVGRMAGRQVAAGSGAGRSGDGGVGGQVDEGVAGLGVEADQQRRSLRVQPGDEIVRAGPAGSSDPPDADGYRRDAGDHVDGAGGDQLVQADRVGAAGGRPVRFDGRAVVGRLGLPVRGRLAPVVAGVHTHPRPNGASDLPADRPGVGQPAPNRRPYVGISRLAEDTHRAPPARSPPRVGTTPPRGAPVEPWRVAASSRRPPPHVLAALHRRVARPAPTWRYGTGNCAAAALGSGPLHGPGQLPNHAGRSGRLGGWAAAGGGLGVGLGRGRLANQLGSCARIGVSQARAVSAARRPRI